MILPARSLARSLPSAAQVHLLFDAQDLSDVAVVAVVVVENFVITIIPGKKRQTDRQTDLSSQWTLNFIFDFSAVIRLDQKGETDGLANDIRKAATVIQPNLGHWQLENHSF